MLCFCLPNGKHLLTWRSLLIPHWMTEWASALQIIDPKIKYRTCANNLNSKYVTVPTAWLSLGLFYVAPSSVGDVVIVYLFHNDWKWWELNEKARGWKHCRSILDVWVFSPDLHSLCFHVSLRRRNQSRKVWTWSNPRNSIFSHFILGAFLLNVFQTHEHVHLCATL